jgi:ribosomal peptide maturation radical SAM protein 1
MAPDTQLDVLIAFMPFGNQNFPSLGASLLKAALMKRSINCRVEYYNLAFAKAISLGRYSFLSDFRGTFLGEWIFSHVAFGKDDEASRIAHEDALLQLLSQHGRKSAGGYLPSQVDFRSTMMEIEEQARIFVDSIVDEIQKINPKILGFSTMFAQNCSSLAVARRVKERLGANAPLIIFGGSNCEGVMGLTLLKAFPWIDYVCCGEGDQVFVEFVESFLQGKDTRIQGIVGRHADGMGDFSTPAPVRNLDELPFPDFADYFATLRDLGLDDVMTPSLAIETSRGCWWGEISHCTFCGLNGLTMKYRAKSDDRIFRELDYLVAEWGPLTLQVVDNILNLGFFKSFFRELIRRRMKLNLLFETKSNLKREEIQLLRQAGVRHIQPGIESLSDDILKEMKKGVTGLQNVWLLKTCREIGISLSWNWLTGFPKEEPSEYERMASWVPLLYHLQPPLGFGSIHLDRFSPNFNFPNAFGIRNVRAAHQYRSIYPLEDRTLHDLAYYFDFDYEDGRNPEGYTSQLRDAILGWMRAWNTSAATTILPSLHRPFTQKLVRPLLGLLGAPIPAMLGAPVLCMLDLRAFALIWDTRPCASKTVFVVTGMNARILRYCNNIRGVDGIIQHFGNLGYENADVAKAMSDLAEKNLLIRDSGRCLALAPKITISMVFARFSSGPLRRLTRLISGVNDITPNMR